MSTAQQVLRQDEQFGQLDFEADFDLDVEVQPRQEISMVQKFLLMAVLVALVLSSTTPTLAIKPTDFFEKEIISTTVRDRTFDQWGYNRVARLFLGTGREWCMGKFNDVDWCTAYLGPYANDRLVMKWNSDWERGNKENWTNPPYDAWEDDQWNGITTNGTGRIWHYKIVWVGPCGENGTPLPDGGYCLWGKFKVLMEHAQDVGYGPGYQWFAHELPSGYVGNQ